MSNIISYANNFIPYGIMPFFTVLFLIIFLVFIFRTSFDSHFSRAIFYFSLNLFVWLSTKFLAILFNNFLLLNFLKYIYLISWIFIPVSFFNFVSVNKKRRWELFLYFSIAMVLSIYVVATNSIFVQKLYFGNFFKIKNPTTLFVNVFYFYIIAHGLILLFKEYLSAENLTRRKRGFLLWLGPSIGFMISTNELTISISRNNILNSVDFGFGSILSNFYINLFVIAGYSFLLLLFYLNFKYKFFSDSKLIIVILIFLDIPFAIATYFLMCNYGNSVYPISSIGVLIAVILMGYSVLKYRLIDFDSFVKKFFIYIISASFYIFLFIFLISSFNVSKENQNVLFLFMISIVFFFNPVNNFVQSKIISNINDLKYNYEDLINNISRKLVSILEYDKILDLIKGIIISNIKASSFVFFLYDNKNNNLKKVLSLENKSKIEILSFTSLPVKLLMLFAKPVLREEIVDDQQKELLSFFDELETSLILPIIYKGSLKGIFCLGEKRNGALFSNKDIQLLTILANSSIIAIENARLYELAIRDELTGLYIVRFFNQRIMEEINVALRLGRKITIFMIDIDFFKKINDTYGHQAGDVILREVASVLKKEVRSIDLVARYGGEEFTVILPETANRAGELVAERMRKSIEEYNFYNEIRVTVSIGIATLNSQTCNCNFVETSSDDVKREELFNLLKKYFVGAADKAMYKAKENGRNRCENYGEIDYLKK